MIGEALKFIYLFTDGANNFFETNKNTKDYKKNNICEIKQRENNRNNFVLSICFNIVALKGKVIDGDNANNFGIRGKRLCYIESCMQ